MLARRQTSRALRGSDAHVTCTGGLKHHSLRPALARLHHDWALPATSDSGLAGRSAEDEPSTSGARTHSLRRPAPMTHDEQPLASRALAGGMALWTAAAMLLSPPAADAVLNSPNAQIARSADAALRRSIPSFNPEIKDIQRNLEDIAYLLRIPQRKPYGTMAKDVEQALDKFNQRDRLLDGAPQTDRAQAIATLDNLYASLKKVELAVAAQQPEFISPRVAEALRYTAELELLQAPGLPFSLPKDYRNLPRLVGRSVVQLQIQRADGSLAFLDPVKGGLSSTGTIEITLDGYSAPINSGRFLENVLSGQYNDRPIEASRTAVVAPTPPTVQPTPVPLEILPLGEFDPIYRLPLDVQSGELPVLPLSINGAVSFTHIQGNDSFLDGDAFFMFKFDKQQAGLAGLAFDEGTFAVFGYVTQGVDVMNALQSGDRIVKATVVSGADKLVRPNVG